jgi:ketosteroid isomerase-like protein
MEAADMEQLIRATYARWSRGDRSFDPETMHPEIEIRSVAGMLTGRIADGRAAAAEG